MTNGESIMPDQTFTTDHEREAYELGKDAAIAAASWVVDGNTSQDHIRRMVAMLDAGDPVAYDYLPAQPNLSGEWADAPTPLSLAQDIFGTGITGTQDYPPEELNEIADAWEAGVFDTFQYECERILRDALDDRTED
jgi:hypothetical protein